LLDSLIGLYRTRIRSKRWYRRIFFHLVHLAVVNVCIERKCQMRKLFVCMILKHMWQRVFASKAKAAQLEHSKRREVPVVVLMMKKSKMPCQ